MFEIRRSENDAGGLELQHQRLCSPIAAGRAYLSTELESDLLEVRLSSRHHDATTSNDGSSERDLVNVHVRRDRSSGGGAKSWNDVDDSRREAGLDEEVAESESTERGELAGLEDDRAAGCELGKGLARHSSDFEGEQRTSECRSQLPGHHEQRVVPRNDLWECQERQSSSFGLGWSGTHLTADSDRLSDSVYLHSSKCISVRCEELSRKHAPSWSWTTHQSSRRRSFHLPTQRNSDCEPAQHELRPHKPSHKDAQARHTVKKIEVASDAKALARVGALELTCAPPMSERINRLAGEAYQGAEHRAPSGRRA